MNKKQLIVTGILLSLMISLSLIQELFNKNFEKVVLINSGINSFKEYNIDDSNCIISLPCEWLVIQNADKDQYISDVLNFADKDNKLTGSLQIINTKEQVDIFAERDCRNQSLEYSNLKIMPYKNKNMIGVLSTYKTSVINGYNYKNECYYLQLGEDKIAKILFNVNQNYYKDNIKTIFNSIISSIEIDKS